MHVMLLILFFISYLNPHLYMLLNFQSPENSLNKRAINKNYEDRIRQLRHERSASETEDGYLRNIKRQKKLNYGLSELTQPFVSHSEVVVTPNSELELESRVPPVAPRQPVSDGSFMRKNICAFCQSSKVSQVSFTYLYQFKILCAPFLLLLKNILESLSQYVT
jgi:hypothetical protein